jgi:hypothetical protein
MVNEDIMTAIRNGINHGETLNSIVQTLIRSGYNPREVEEASRFFSGGVLDLEPPSLHKFVMPEEKGILSKFSKPKEQTIQPQPLPTVQSNQEIKQTIFPTQIYSSDSYSKPIAQELNRIHPPKHSFAKEIVLLIILLILIGVLILILVFRKDILAYFSNLQG